MGEPAGESGQSWGDTTASPICLQFSLKPCVPPDIMCLRGETTPPPRLHFPSPMLVAGYKMKCQEPQVSPAPASLNCIPDSEQEALCAAAGSLVEDSAGPHHRVSLRGNKLNGAAFLQLPLCRWNPKSFSFQRLCQPMLPH